MSAAGANPGDLDFDLDLLWFIVLSQLLWPTSSVLMVGAHVTRASAPARRVTFASTKVTQNRLPSLHPSGFPYSNHLRRDVGKNSLPLKQFADDHRG
jgi:hypothetical protein